MSSDKLQRTRHHNRSFKQSKVLSCIKQNCQLQFSSLSTLTRIDVHQFKLKEFQKMFTLQNVSQYIQQALDQVYQQDSLGIKQRIKLLLFTKLSLLKPKIMERINLMKYLINSLQYKTFAEINIQIQKQWRKNILFFSITTIWCCCMKIYVFEKPQEFAHQYQKFRNFLANVTYYYFKECLKILNSKNVPTFNFILDESSHQIINHLKDWSQLYKNFLLVFKNKQIQQKDLCLKSYDLCSLQINQDYLNVQTQNNELTKTTQQIQMFQSQIKIVQKINILKKIRANFLEQIYINSKNIAQKKKLMKISHLQKDDIIGCMIYCIVKANLINFKISMRAFNLLIGPKINEVLSKKGVDSYFADLQCAIEYLYSQNLLIVSQTTQRFNMTSIQNDF